MRYFKFTVLKPTVEDSRQKLHILYHNEPWKTVDLGAFPAHDPKQMSGKGFALSRAEIGNCDYVLIIDDDIFIGSASDERVLESLLSSNPDIAWGHREHINLRDMVSATRVVWSKFCWLFMSTFKIPWGGFLFIKTQTVWPDFKEAITNTLTDDVWLPKAFPDLKKEDLNIFLTDATEAGTWADLFEFTTRQLIHCRIYGPWWAVWLSWLLAVLIIPCSLSLPISYLGFYILAFLIFYFALGFKSKRLWLALPTALFLHILTVPMAQFKRSIKWKNVTYELKNFH